jgi:hypothetical protein
LAVSGERKTDSVGFAIWSLVDDTTVEDADLRVGENASHWLAAKATEKRAAVDSFILMSLDLIENVISCLLVAYRRGMVHLYLRLGGCDCNFSSGFFSLSSVVAADFLCDVLGRY